MLMLMKRRALASLWLESADAKPRDRVVNQHHQQVRVHCRDQPADADGSRA